MKHAGVILAFVAVALAPIGVRARRVESRFLMDFAPGLAVPVHPSGYRGGVGPSFKMSWRVGGELWFTRGFGIAGEVDIDASPLMVPDGPSFRVRGLVGLRLLFGFRVGAFFIRQALGVDWNGFTPEYGPGFPVSPPMPYGPAVATEPGLGVQFNVARRAVVGFATDVPVAFDRGFVFVDVQLLAFFGLRL